MAKLHFYVVWKGRKPGIYDNWPDTAKQVEGFSGAKFKGFNKEWQAKRAFKRPFTDYMPEDIKGPQPQLRPRR